MKRVFVSYTAGKDETSTSVEEVYKAFDAATDLNGNARFVAGQPKVEEGFLASGALPLDGSLRCCESPIVIRVHRRNLLFELVGSFSTAAGHVGDQRGRRDFAIGRREIRCSQQQLRHPDHNGDASQQVTA